MTTLTDDEVGRLIRIALFGDVAAFRTALEPVFARAELLGPLMAHIEEQWETYEQPMELDLLVLHVQAARKSLKATEAGKDQA